MFTKEDDVAVADATMLFLSKKILETIAPSLSRMQRILKKADFIFVHEKKCSEVTLSHTEQTLRGQGGYNCGQFL